jgi:hypothetical protein
MRPCILMLLALAALLALAGCPKPATESSDATGGTAGATKPGTTTPEPGAKAWAGNAPDFAFTTLDGKSQKLSAMAGMPIVLNFWADW